jgi:hypothetical protein
MVVKRAIVIIGLCVFCCAAGAQDLNGYWKGTLSMVGCFAQNNIELQIHMNGQVVNGDSYHYQDIDNYVKKRFEGYYIPSQKRITINEGMVLTYHIPFRCVICVKNFHLQYSREGNVETLSGQWDGNVLHTNTNCNGGSIVLTRIKESAFKEVPEIKVDTGTIRLDFYDNAEIDDDSISLKINNNVILSHQRLSAKAITSYIKIDPQNSFYEVEMIAENLGSIPPNTAILIITAGELQYRLSLSSTESKSARVRFVYNPSKDPKQVNKNFVY